MTTITAAYKDNDYTGKDTPCLNWEWNVILSMRLIDGPIAGPSDLDGLERSILKLLTRGAFPAVEIRLVTFKDVGQIHTILKF